MQCATCGTENPADNKYCGECGSSLAPACPHCGAANPAGKRFCGECGSPLAALPDQETTPPGEPSAAGRIPPASLAALVAERRVCSVLFCDLVGFTAF
jgi:predicted nucleic acid-binding Zn ribbon protein